jgi:phosphoglycolate phosphatase-like HAD superfamily hydrolase
VGEAVWDVLAARAAQMPCLAIASGSASEEALREAGADAVTTLGLVQAELRRRGSLRG